MLLTTLFLIRAQGLCGEGEESISKTWMKNWYRVYFTTW